jgi:hypothetical protein
MELLKKIIDQLPFIIIALAFLLWAAALFVEKKAKSDPAVNAWDEWAPKLTWASRLYSQAIDWLADTKNLNLGPNQTKLGELNRLVKEFEGKVATGKYLEAIADVVGYWTAAKGKLPTMLSDVAIPPASIPPVGSQKVGDSKSL